MPAKAGIQDFEKFNKIKNCIPAFAGMTTLFPNCDTVPGGREVGEGGICLIFSHLPFEKGGYDGAPFNKLEPEAKVPGYDDSSRSILVVA